MATALRMQLPLEPASRRRRQERGRLSCEASRPGDGAPVADLPGNARRSLLASVGLALGLAAAGRSEANILSADDDIDRGFPSARPTAGPDTTVTSRVYIDFGLCPEAVPFSERGLGDKRLCNTNLEPLGRVVVGLYGNAVPTTVANFTRLVAPSNGGPSYAGTVVNRIRPGLYFEMGKLGQGRLGELDAQLPLSLAPNPEVVSSSSFLLRHDRGGLLSLPVAFADGLDGDRATSGPSPTFLMTLGPGPAPSLDGESIVFGVVVEGLDVLARIAAVPTLGASVASVIREYNGLAQRFGDDRAERARAAWARPSLPIVISACGLLS